MKNFLSQLHHILRKYSNHIAVTHYLEKNQSLFLRYHEIESRAKKLAYILQRYGLKPGEYVGLFMIRSPEHIISMIAAMKCGAVFFSLHPKYTIHQVFSITQICKPSLLVIDGTGLFKLANTTKDVFRDMSIIYYDEGEPTDLHHKCLDRLSQSAHVIHFSADIPIEEEFNVWEPASNQDPVLALFTSGSTGTPKGVLVSHDDLYRRVMSECKAYRLNSEDRLLNLLPFSFDVGLNQVLSALATGAHIVLLNSWMPQDMCTVMEKYEITGISAVPSIWSDFLILSPEKTKRCFEKIRYITVSGGDLPVSKLKQLRDRFPHTDIYKTYGQTETFRSSMLMPEEFDEKMASVGKPLEGTTVDILSPAGQQVPCNEQGEIIHGGMGTMTGYVSDPTGTKQKKRKYNYPESQEANSEEFIFTGDLGKLDDEGYLYILGRMDSMLKIHGNRVYPQEIEPVIYEHKNVKDAAVFGIKNEDWEDQIIAEVIPKAGDNLSRNQLRLFLSRHLPSYMIPTHIAIVDSFPRTPTGKIDISALKNKYKDSLQKNNQGDHETE